VRFAGSATSADLRLSYPVTTTMAAQRDRPLRR
jgi:hypothetical protein